MVYSSLNYMYRDIKLLKLTNVLYLLILSNILTKIQFQRPIKQLHQDLEAELRDSGIISTFGALISDKGVLSPCNFIKAEDDPGVVKSFAYQVLRLLNISLSRRKREKNDA